jgi:hypothetical protein
MLNILSLLKPSGIVIEVPTLLLYWKSTHSQYANKRVCCVPIKLYLQKQEVAQIWLMNHSLLAYVNVSIFHQNPTLY